VVLEVLVPQFPVVPEDNLSVEPSVEVPVEKPTLLVVLASVEEVVAVVTT
jgi:hypothetical protein